MIVSEEEALSRLNSPDNLINKLSRRVDLDGAPQLSSDVVEVTDEQSSDSNIEIKELYANRTGPKGIPPMVQTLAVTLGKLTTQQSSAETFGMAQENVAYLTREGKHIDREFVKKKVSAVHDSALDAMIESIDLLRPKLSSVKKAKDLSGIASDLSRIVNRTSPQEANRNQVKVVVFAPNMKDESFYEEIIVSPT